MTINFFNKILFKVLVFLHQVTCPQHALLQYKCMLPARAETPSIVLVGYIGRCHHSLRVLNRIPNGAVISLADALQRLIREVLDRGSDLAWGRLLSFSY